MMNKRNSELVAYLKTLYVPESNKEKYKFILDWVRSNGVKLREITPDDEWCGNLDCVVIVTKGKAPRESFQEYQIKKIDFAKVGKAFAEAYIYEAESGLGYPERAYYKNPKISIIEK